MNSESQITDKQWSCLGAFAFCPGFLTASELSFGTELDGNSRYAWRGRDF
jgi:hypothetical protein